MTESSTDNSFIGRGWSFPPTFAVNMTAGTGSVCMVQDDEDIRQSLKVLFSTMHKERVMLPEYGCSLHDYVFESVDSSLFAKIRSTLSTAIMRYEPRISPIDITVTQSDTLEGLLLISLTYLIRQTNTRSNMIYPYYLQGEGTNVRSIA